jgi:type I restriction enzyme, S subunit
MKPVNKKQEQILKSYKHSPIGLIPADWEVMTIGEVCSIYVGKDLKEDNFSTSKTERFKYPVFSNTVGNEGLYGFYDIEEYSGESLTIVGRGSGLGTAFTRNGSFGAIGRLLILFPSENTCAHYLTEYVNNKLNIHQESGRNTSINRGANCWVQNCHTQI